MTTIINNKKYNTETAERICYIYVGDGDEYLSKSLYRKKTGEFFYYDENCIYVIGGLMDEGDGFHITSKITPTSEEEAKAFVILYGSADKYEELFGEVEE